MSKVNGFDLATFDGLATTQDAGVPVDIVHPATQEPLGVRFLVVGPDSAQARAAERAVLSRAMQRGARKMSPSEIQDEALFKVASCVKAWEGMVNEGQALECTNENVLMVFAKAPWIAEQIAEVCGSRAAFFPGSGRNSAPASEA